MTDLAYSHKDKQEFHLVSDADSDMSLDVADSLNLSSSSSHLASHADLASMSLHQVKGNSLAASVSEHELAQTKLNVPNYEQNHGSFEEVHGAIAGLYENEDGEDSSSLSSTLKNLSYTNALTMSAQISSEASAHETKSVLPGHDVAPEELAREIRNIVVELKEQDAHLPHQHLTTSSYLKEHQHADNFLSRCYHSVRSIFLPAPMASVIPDTCACHNAVASVSHSEGVLSGGWSSAGGSNGTSGINHETNVRPHGLSGSAAAHHDDTLEDEALFADTYVTAGSANEDLALKAKLLATLGWRMASVGAETRLIVQSVKKMAHDLGCKNIDLSISRDGITVKLRRGHAIAVEFKEIKHFAINMHSLARLHQICLCVSEGKLTDPNKIFMAIRAVRPRHYNKTHLVWIEAVAGACFAYLNGGNLAVCCSAFLGGLFLMYYRFSFIRRGFFESFTFMMSAFIGSLIAGLVCQYGFKASHADVLLAATATTLLLVPGFPLINGFLDIFKGHVPIGLTRLVIAVVLVIAASVGLLTSTYITAIMATIIPVA